MGYRIDFSPRAERDLESVVRFIACKSSEAAIRIGQSLVDLALSLTDFPNRGAPVKRRPGVRKIPYRHYVMFYKVNDTQQIVQILRIWDNRRDPESFRL